MEIQFVPNRINKENYKDCIKELRNKTWGFENIINDFIREIKTVKKIVIEIDSLNNEIDYVTKNIVFIKSKLSEFSDINQVLVNLKDLVLLIPIINDDEKRSICKILQDKIVVQFPYRKISIKKIRDDICVIVNEEILSEKSIFTIEIFVKDNIFFCGILLESNNPFEIAYNLNHIVISKNHIRIIGRNKKIFREFNLTTSST